MNGFINAYKPLGYTASDIVVITRKRLNLPKVGHLGTLDPQAEGVLPLAVGNATKLFELLTYKRKVYIAQIKFGILTDTLDSTGKTIQTSENIPNIEQVRQIIKIFVGVSQQTPPQHSAINVNGVRAYKLARQGLQVELASRQIEIFSLDLLRQIDENTYEIKICCSGGTYIRSLVRDIAKSLNTVAYMSGLIRTQSGFFSIENSIKIDDISIKDIIPITSQLADIPKLIIADKYYFQLSNGIKFAVDENDATMKTVYCKGELFGVGNIVDNKLNLRYYLRENETTDNK